MNTAVIKNTAALILGGGRASASIGSALESAGFGQAFSPVGAEGAEAVFVWPENAPLCSPKTLETLMENLEGFDAVTPVCRAASGWPVLVRSEMVDIIREAEDEKSFLAALRRAGAIQGYVPVPDFLCTVRQYGPEDEKLMALYAGTEYRGVPTAERCRELLQKQGTLPHIVRHCEKTAEVAVELARCLVQSGYDMDVDLTYAGAVLHDIVRLDKPHAMNGALLLAGLGYFETAEIVRWHMDLPIGMEGDISETSVVFLADKLAMEDRRVSLRRRHENSCVKSASEEMRAYIWRRFEVARITEKAVAAALELGRDTL